MAAIIGGTVLGAIVGGSVGHAMDLADRWYVTRTLEYAPSREVVSWQNPDTRTRYELEPLATYEQPDGRYCREYRTAATIGGETREIYGTACRQPDGAWELVR
jgi:surface antigen